VANVKAGLFRERYATDFFARRLARNEINQNVSYNAYENKGNF
jgi:hypothetical protein